MDAFLVVLQKVMGFIWNKQKKNRLSVGNNNQNQLQKLKLNHYDLINDLWEAETPQQQLLTATMETKKKRRSCGLLHSERQ